MAMLTNLTAVSHEIGQSLTTISSPHGLLCLVELQ